MVSSRRKVIVRSCCNCAMIDTTILLQVKQVTVFNKDSKIPFSFVQNRSVSYTVSCVKSVLEHAAKATAGGFRFIGSVPV